MGSMPDNAEQLCNEKIARFRQLPAYEQLRFWKDNSDDYESILTEYILDNHHQKISWDEIAKLLYELGYYPQETIVTHWEEE